MACEGKIASAIARASGTAFRVASFCSAHPAVSVRQCIVRPAFELEGGVSTSFKLTFDGAAAAAVEAAPGSNSYSRAAGRP